MRAILLLMVVGCAAPKSMPPTESKPKYTGLARGLESTEEIKEKMKHVAKALGVKCDYCHDIADFTAPTVNKKIANQMFLEFIWKLQPHPEGGWLFCDTCHQGKTTFLDRSDEEALKAWMKENFVEKLRKKETGEPIECETCHGESRFKFLPRSL